MATPKVARDAAELELGIWVETLGSEPDAESREKLIAMVMDGRIDFDAASETFTYRLRSPVALENGTKLAEVKVADITVRQFADAYKSIKVTAGAAKEASVSMDSVLLQLSAATGQPFGVVERLKNRDFTMLQALMGFFE